MYLKNVEVRAAYVSHREKMNRTTRTLVEIRARNERDLRKLAGSDET